MLVYKWSPSPDFIKQSDVRHAMQACLGDVEVICSMFAMTVEGLQNTEINGSRIIFSH